MSRSRRRRSCPSLLQGQSGWREEPVRGKKNEESNCGDALDVNRRHRPRPSDDDWRKKKAERKKTSVNGRLEEEGVMKVRRPVGGWLSGVAARTDGHCKPVPSRFEQPSQRPEPDFRFCWKETRKTTLPSRYGTTLGVPETNASQM